MGDFGSALSSGIGDIGSAMSGAMGDLSNAFGGSSLGGIGNAMSSAFGGGGGGSTAANFTPVQPFSDPNTAQAVSMNPPTSTANQDPTGTAGGTQTGTTPPQNQQNQPQNQDQDRAQRLANLRKQLMQSVKQLQQGRNPYQTGGGQGGGAPAQGGGGGGAPQPTSPAGWRGWAGEAPPTQGPSDETPLPNPLDAAGQIDTSGVPPAGPGGLGLRPGASPTGVDTGTGAYDANPSGRNAAGPWGYGGGRTAGAQPPIEGLPAPGDPSTLEPPVSEILPGIGGGFGKGLPIPGVVGMGIRAGTQALQPTPTAPPSMDEAPTNAWNQRPSGVPDPAQPAPAAQPVTQPARPVTPTPGTARPTDEQGRERPPGYQGADAIGKPVTKDQYETWLKRQGVKPADAKKKADNSTPAERNRAHPDPTVRGGAPQGGPQGQMDPGRLFRDIIGGFTGNPMALRDLAGQGGGMGGMLGMLPMLAMGLGGLFGGGGGGRHGHFMHGGGFHPGGVGSFRGMRGGGGFRGGFGGGRPGGGFGRMPGFGGGNLRPGYYPMRGGGFGFHPGGFHEGWDAHDNWSGGGGVNPLASALAYGGDQGQQGGYDQSGNPTPGGQYNRQGQYVGGGGRRGGGYNLGGAAAPSTTPGKGPNGQPLPYTGQQAADFTRQVASSLGIDPQQAEAVLRAESSYGQNYSNLKDPGAGSHGPFQLDIAPGALGQAFMNQTGEDPRDPNTWKDQIVFALRYVQSHGWSPWTTARNMGFGGRGPAGDPSKTFAWNYGQGGGGDTQPATASGGDATAANVGPASQVFPSWTPS